MAEYVIKIKSNQKDFIVKHVSKPVKINAKVKRGLQGPAGANGATGATGPQGPAGPAGADGVVQSVVAGTGISVNSADPANPIVTATGGAGAVDSVNGQTGVVVLDQDDVGDGTTYKQYSQTEKTKLAGIETGADVTDSANVDAAGATMNTDTSLAGNGYFLDEDTMSSDSATKVPSQQSVKAYVDTELGDLPVLAGGTRLDLDTTTTPGTAIFNVDTSIGLSGGSTLTGGVGASQSLTLSSTNNATKGTIIFGTSMYDEANNWLGIGMTPTMALDVTGAGSISTSLTTPLVYGGDGSGDNLMLESTSNATKGRVLISDQITLLGTGRTFTSAPGTLILFPSTTTHILDFASANFNNVLGFLSTIEFAQSSVAIPATLFNNNSVIKNTSSSGAISLGIVSSFIQQNTTQADTSTVTMTGLNDFWSRPRFSVVSTGALNIGDWNQFLAGANASGIGTGVTVTNRRGLYVLNSSGGSGTLTNNYGIEVASQQRGTAINYGIKVDLPSGATTNQAITLTDATGVAAGGIGFRGTTLQLYAGSATTLDTNANFQTTGTAANSATAGSGVIVRQNSGSALATDDRGGFFLFAGYDGATMRNAGGINGHAAGTWSTGVCPMYFAFATTDETSTTRAERFRVGGMSTDPAYRATQINVGTVVSRHISTATNDDPQKDLLQFRATTTNNTIATLGSVPLTASKTTVVEATITARRTGGSSGTADDGAGYKLLAVFQGGAQIGSTTVTVIGENQAGWDATLDYSANTCRLRVTGATNNNITWHGHADVMMVGS